MWRVGDDVRALSHMPWFFHFRLLRFHVTALFDVYTHVRVSSYSQVPESQLVECVNSMFALELECVNSMFALSLVSTLVTNILLASVQTNDTPCAALLCCAQNPQRTLADAIFVRLPQARTENRCALRTLLVEDEFHLCSCNLQQNI